jgi:hypothetical protein
MTRNSKSLWEAVNIIKNKGIDLLPKLQFVIQIKLETDKVPYEFAKFFDNN